MTKKFVAVLNKAYEIPQLFNALGHTTAGLVGNIENPQVISLVPYRDKSGNIYSNISEYPFIILKSNSSKIKIFRLALVEKGISHSCFLDTMLSGGSAIQVKNTEHKLEEQLDILAITAFGEKETLDFLTKKFSLWS